VVLPPIVVAELMSGAQRPSDRAALQDLLTDLHLHQTPFGHWLRVGELRRALRAKGLAVSTPDAHVAQCALDLNVPLLSTDAVFRRIARHTQLRLG
jgi:predicted nucleic acid-binding protein